MTWYDYNAYNLLVKAGYIKDTGRNNYNIPCPFHGEEEGSSLSINLVKNVFKCFSPQCEDSFGVLEKLLVMLNLDTAKVKDYVKGFDSTPERIFDRDTKNDLPPEFDIDFIKQRGRRDYTYFLSRGISEPVLQANKCFVNKYFKRAYIPIWQDGICYGYVGRTLLTKEQIDEIIEVYVKKYGLSFQQTKQLMADGEYDMESQRIKRWKPLRRYVNNFGLEKESVVFESLYNDYENIDTTVIVEGQINALMANTYRVNSIAIIGSHPTLKQIRYIINKLSSLNQRIILFFDNDKAGRNNVIEFNRVAGSLQFTVDWDDYDPDVYNDICDLDSQEQFDDLIESRYLIK